MTDAEIRKALRLVLSDWSYRQVEKAWGIPRMTLWRQAHTDAPIDPRLLPWLGVAMTKVGTVDHDQLAQANPKKGEGNE